MIFCTLEHSSLGSTSLCTECAEQALFPLSSVENQPSTQIVSKTV